MGFFDSGKREQQIINGNLEGTEDYEDFSLQDLADGEEYTGQPYLFDIQSNTWKEKDDNGEETGKEVTKISAIIGIFNHDEEEKIIGRLNLKHEEDDHTFWKKSLGFDILDSIEVMHGEQPTQENTFTISFKELQSYINNLKNCTIQVKEYNGKFNYNTFRFIKAEA